MLAGFTSLSTTLLILQLFIGITILASARTSMGMLVVGFCCLVGGYLFDRLGTKKEDISNG
jgi:hypothetical protein